MKKQKSQERKREKESRKIKKSSKSKRQRQMFRRRRNQKKRLKEVNKLCSLDDSCIPRSVLKKVVKDILLKESSHRLNRISKRALNALHSAAESELTSVMHLANIEAMTNGKVTVGRKELKLGAAVMGLLGPNSVQGGGWTMPRSDFVHLMKEIPHNRAYKVVRPKILGQSKNGESDQEYKDSCNI